MITEADVMRVSLKLRVSLKFTCLFSHLFLHEIVSLGLMKEKHTDTSHNYV